MSIDPTIMGLNLIKLMSSPTQLDLYSNNISLRKVTQAQVARGGIDTQPTISTQKKKRRRKKICSNERKSQKPTPR